MKVKIVLMMVMVAAAVVSVRAQRATYAELVAKVQGGDLTVDFQELRLAFADQPALAPVGDDVKGRAAMVKAMNDKNFKEALKLAEAQQKTCYVDTNAHIVASLAHQALGDDKKAKFHEGVYLGLVNSILKSGDGNSTKTAYLVISVAEEFALLKALELKRTAQEYLAEDGHKYELFTVADSAGGTSKLYFNIDKVPPPPAKPTAK